MEPWPFALQTADAARSCRHQSRWLAQFLLQPEDAWSVRIRHRSYSLQSLYPVWSLCLTRELTANQKRMRGMKYNLVVHLVVQTYTDPAARAVLTSNDQSWPDYSTGDLRTRVDTC